MQKAFILIFGALLASHLPAKAQPRPTQVYPMQEHNASIMRLMAAAPTHLPLAGSLLIHPLEEPPARFNILPGAAYTLDQSLEHLSPVEVVRTTFVRQASVTFLQLWGGRLQLRLPKQAPARECGGRFFRLGRSFGLSRGYTGLSGRENAERG